MSVIPNVFQEGSSVVGKALDYQFKCPKFDQPVRSPGI